MTHETHPTPPAADRPRRIALTISALALTALIIFRAGLPGPAPAYASDLTIKAGDLSAMTTESNGREFLYIVDDRAEMLMIYQLSREGLVLRESQSLPRLFDAARGQSGSGRGIQR